MSLRPEPLPPIPDVTAAAVRAAFPKGNLYVDLRAEFGTLYTDRLFTDLYPPEGRPVEVAPWRLALVVVMQYIPTVSPLLTPVSSRNTLLLQSLPTNTPFWQVNSRRRKDDTRVGTAARGVVERLSRLPRRLP